MDVKIGSAGALRCYYRTGRTALSRSLPPPPPQAANIMLSAVAVQVVRRMCGCLASMLRPQGATKCIKLIME